MEIVDFNTARTVQSVQTYIERTKVPERRGYSPTIDTIALFAKYGEQDSPLKAIILAFEYGRAKGYRQAKAERKKGKR